VGYRRLDSYRLWLLGRVQVLRASAHDSDTEGTATTRRPRPDDPDGDEMESQDASVTTPSHEPSAHPDEHQILLDTQRSFVLYPTGTRPSLDSKAYSFTDNRFRLVGEDSVKDREPLQIQLHELLVSVFRRHPKLSYFQVRLAPPHIRQPKLIAHR
jgi:hypothetical protein